jgi:hypothetical protein
MSEVAEIFGPFLATSEKCVSLNFEDDIRSAKIRLEYVDKRVDD